MRKSKVPFDIFKVSISDMTVFETDVTNFLASYLKTKSCFTAKM
jgi:hypothetical protein